MNYLAFDLGGSSGKLTLGTFRSGTMSHRVIHRFQNRPVSLGGSLYWDILHIYSELCVGIRKAVAITGDDIGCIGFDSFCNDFALISKRGELLTPVRCYRDSRTARCRGHTYRVMSPWELYRINGNQNGLFNTLLQLDAMRQEGQSWMLENCHRVLFVSDLLIFFLTGEAVTEYTTASVTQMYDFNADDWSEEILQKYHIPRSIFAPIVRPGTIVGKTTESFNREIGTKGFLVSTVCQHDTASAFLAAIGAEDHAIISCGTWCLVGMETDKPVITKAGYEANIANEGSCEGHHRLLRNVMGTWIVQEIVRQLEEEGTPCSYEELEARAKAGGAAGLFLDVDAPQFFEPGHMMDKIRDFCREHCGKAPGDLGQMMFAVYEGLAFKYRLSIEKLEELTGKRFCGINMLGGGIQSGFMCQMTANICRRPVCAGPADASALGNLIVQMTANGEIASVREGRECILKTADTVEYLPDGDERWEKDYQVFQKLFAQET